MAFVLSVLIATLIVIWLHILWSRRHFYKVALQLPGPIGWPIIGLSLDMMHPEKYLQFMESVGRKYKSPFISWMGPKCFLYVNDPETVQIVMNSPQCVNKGDFYRFMANAIGDGLFTSSVPKWNIHRRLINPAFTRPILNDFLPIFSRESTVLIKKLEIESQNGDLELYEVLKRSVLEAACQTTMGQRMNFQNDGSKEIFNSYNGMTEVCVRRMLSPWLYPDFIYKRSPLFFMQQNVVKVLYGFVEGLLTCGIKSNNSTHLTGQKRNPDEKGEEKREEKAEEKKKEEVRFIPNNFDERNNESHNEGIDAAAGIRKSKAIFVEQMRMHVDQGCLTWNDVRDEANVIIAATFETTSTALYFVCLCLAMNPECQDKLYKELIELFPSASSSAFSSADPSMSSENSDVNDDANEDAADDFFVTKKHIENMAYTEMVIHEAMRLFAPVPMVLRRVSDEGCRLNDSITLPIDTQIGIDIFNMQRSELVWGPNAKEFRPDLHFGSTESVAADSMRHPFAFIPFTRGLRMCLGSQYAMMIMKVFVAKIFRNFRLETDARMENLKIKGTISLKLVEYPKIRIQRRHRL